SPARPRTYSTRWARVSALSLPDAPAARPPVAGRVPACTSAGGDEPRPTVDAEGAALPARHRVLRAIALRSWKVRVHHAAAFRTVADRRVAPPVIHVLAGGARR